MAAIDAVCFDLDGTHCVRTRADAWLHELRFDRVGLDPLWPVEGIYEVDTDDLPPVDTTREYWVAFYRRVADHTGTDPGHAPALADATGDVVVDDPHVAFREGAETALEHARERYRVALVPHGSQRAQAAKLDALGIVTAFDATVFRGPAEPCPGKPAAEPFRRAAEALDASPGRTVHVDDRLDGDVAGANEAGLVSSGVPDGAAHPIRNRRRTTYSRRWASCRDCLERWTRGRSQHVAHVSAVARARNARGVPVCDRRERTRARTASEASLPVAEQRRRVCGGSRSCSVGLSGAEGSAKVGRRP